MKNKKAQIMLEYTVLIVCVIAALLAMQIYLKRAKEGGLRQVADSLGEQYAPKKTSGHTITASSSKKLDISKTLSEWQAHELYGGNYNFNANDKFNEPDVYATEVNTTLLESTENQTKDETVKKFGVSLYKD